MSSSPIAKIYPASKFQLVWIVPVLAVAVSAWLGIRELYRRGPEITVEFEDVVGSPRPARPSSSIGASPSAS